MVAQGVEQWHSVRAGRVWFPGRTCLAFFRFRIVANLFFAGHWAFSKEWGIECCILLPLLSYFLSPLSIFVNCYINNEPTKKKENKSHKSELFDESEKWFLMIRFSSNFSRKSYFKIISMNSYLDEPRHDKKMSLVWFLTFPSRQCQV